MFGCNRKNRRKIIYIYIYIYININYAKTQNQIREIRNKTQRYLTKKFKEKKHKTLYYIT